MLETDSRPGLVRRLKRARLGLLAAALAASAVTAALPAASLSGGDPDGDRQLSRSRRLTTPATSTPCCSTWVATR